LKVILKPSEAIENVTRSTLDGKDLKKGGLSSTVMDLKMTWWAVLGVEVC
jgi:hypothetical protein